MMEPLCLKSELNLFSGLPIQVAIENSDFEEVHPIATLSDGPIEFYIPGTFEHYIDPSFIFLQLAVKISKRDGSAIAATDKVGPINYLLNTAFENVEVFLNEKQIVSQNNYGYRSILDALLNFPENAQKTFLKSSLFEKDTAKYFDETDPNGNNLGLKARHAVMDLNKEITLFGAMNLDLSFQHKLLLNGVSLKIRLHRAKNSFVLMSNTQGFVLKITKASLLVRKVTVSPSVVLAHNKTLENGVAKYPIRKVDVKTLTIPSGTHSTILPNLFLGPVPNRIVIGFVTKGAYSGDFTKNPFNFQNFNINYISLKIGQRVLPNRPLTPQFSEGEFYRSYIDLFSNMGRYLSSGELNITPEEFQNGLTLFAFDTTPDLCASDLHSSATQNSNISLEVKFSSALTSTINVILYSEFQSEIHIDKLRQVIHSCDQNALIKLNDGLYVPKSLPLKQNSYYDAEQRKITNVPEPTDDTDVVPKGFLTKKIKRLKKQVLLLDEENKHFDCNGYKVTNLGNAENDTDAITVLYLRDYLGKLVTSTETLDFRFMLMEGDSIALKCEFAQHKFFLDGKIRKYRLRYENVPTGINTPGCYIVFRNDEEEEEEAPEIQHFLSESVRDDVNISFKSGDKKSNFPRKTAFFWRETCYHPTNIVEKDAYGGVMVWAGIMTNRRMSLHVFEAGTLNVQRYRDEILEPHARLFREAVGPDVVFMDDNAPSHRANLINGYMESEDM
ncbi:hypothetical protein LAZ67_2003713 [Cordylochernes scorpioides]|uniref:Uncharacterized protein n=1 Tax=Cordylochernes scorpioides TaxID=51811 RepID=A0ABY6K358_9ARAC|nr:hypothetical protein LAZ67_2003713 [Cordylochernes scorpioides]